MFRNGWCFVARGNRYMPITSRVVRKHGRKSWGAMWHSGGRKKKDFGWPESVPANSLSRFASWSDLGVKWSRPCMLIAKARFCYNERSLLFAQKKTISNLSPEDQNFTWTVTIVSHAINHSQKKKCGGIGRIGWTNSVQQLPHPHAAIVVEAWWIRNVLISINKLKRRQHLLWTIVCLWRFVRFLRKKQPRYMQNVVRSIDKPVTPLFTRYTVAA